MNQRVQLPDIGGLNEARKRATRLEKPSSKAHLAAQYVRMSTDMQVYSIANQQAAIKVYAEAHGCEVIATYEDGGKSGLTLQDRPGMRRLLEEILTGTAPFGRLLVYDISRWGRFQDVDEGAHYEYLCRRAGISVDYCAEPFENDGSSFAGVVKGLKRVMAAEYSRELSDKVSVGKIRLVREGFRASGGRPPHGYSRLMIDAGGKPKAILVDGERKAVLTYRIVLTPGPEAEQATVRAIFADYLAGWTMWQIAGRLNARRLPGSRPKSWGQSNVRDVLKSETYIGTLVACTKRSRLGITEPVQPEKWIRIPNAHPALISKETFDAVQKIRIARAGARPTADAVKAYALEIYRKHGKVTLKLVDEGGLMCRSAFLLRFGGMNKMRQQLGLPTQRPHELVDRLHLNGIKNDAIEKVCAMLERNGKVGTVDRKFDRITLDDGCSIQVAIAHAAVIKGGLSWRLSRWPCRSYSDVAAFVLMDDANVSAEGWLFLPNHLWPIGAEFANKKLQKSLEYLGGCADDLWPHIEDAQALRQVNA